MNDQNKKIFKYNMAFYYQSTIFYFAAFIIYTVVRGEFVEDSFRLITRDPIIYFFAIIVLISLISLLYNLFKDRHLEINDIEIAFADRFRRKSFPIQNIVSIKTYSKRSRNKSGKFRLVKIKFSNRRRAVIIRPSDYENVEELLKTFNELKSMLEK